MKNSMVTLSLLVTLLCGFLLLKKNNEVNQARTSLAAAQKERDTIAAKAAQQESRNKTLQTRLHENRVDAFDRSVETEELRQKLSTIKTNTSTTNSLSELFRDQAMKELLKTEAKVGVARNIKALFDAGLAEQLHLDENQSATLKQLLTEKSHVLWDQMMIPMTTGEINQADMAEAGRAIKQALDANEAQTRALLGDEGYNVYERFEKIQPERDRLKKFNTQAASASQYLTSEQQTQLLNAMTDERASFPFQFDPGNPSQMNFTNWEVNFTDEKFDIYNREMQQLNDKILQRAQTILTPTQIALLQKSFKQDQLQSAIVIRTTKAMMAETKK